jgi:hypothetical protein
MLVLDDRVEMNPPCKLNVSTPSIDRISYAYFSLILTQMGGFFLSVAIVKYEDEALRDLRLFNHSFIQIDFKS